MKNLITWYINSNQIEKVGRDLNGFLVDIGLNKKGILSRKYTNENKNIKIKTRGIEEIFQFKRPTNKPQAFSGDYIKTIELNLAYDNLDNIKEAIEIRNKINEFLTKTSKFYGLNTQKVTYDEVPKEIQGGIA